jgi:hypothetical protein
MYAITFPELPYRRNSNEEETDFQKGLLQSATRYRKVIKLEKNNTHSEKQMGIEEITSI